MIGIFDSGEGGRNLLSLITEEFPTEDVIFLSDTENAPYGIKSEEELIRICEANIERLVGCGADCVLIGCCTASTVYPQLNEKCREHSLPIIDAVAAAAARATRNGRIYVLATEHTVRSRAFDLALDGFTVTSFPAQRLVTLIDAGLAEDKVGDDEREYLMSLLSPSLTGGADTLVLGCTHFPRLYRTFSELALKVGITEVISSAKEGALLLKRRYTPTGAGRGRVSELKSVKMII